jgi:hypothetical protein
MDVEDQVMVAVRSLRDARVPFFTAEEVAEASTWNVTTVEATAVLDTLSSNGEEVTRREWACTWDFQDPRTGLYLGDAAPGRVFVQYRPI